MHIIGIDPGTSRIGYAVISWDGKKPKSIIYGCWEIAIKEKGYRLQLINKNISQLIKKYKPEYLASESVYFFNNAKTVMQVSEARGVIIFTAACHKVPMIELAPAEVKQKLTGHGRAEKIDIQNTVKKMLKLKFIPQPDDAADALAIALASLKKINLE